MAIPDARPQLQGLPQCITGTGLTMGFLDRLFGGRFTMPPPEETNLSASAIMKEMRPERSDPAQKKHSRLLPKRWWRSFRKRGRQTGQARYAQVRDGR